MNVHGWTFKGRPGQDVPSNRYHKATNDEGSRVATIRRGDGRVRPRARARDQQAEPSYAGESFTTLRTCMSVCGNGISILFWLKLL